MAGFVNHSDDEQIQDRLRYLRSRMACEMRAALSCRTAKQKNKLVARWQSEYSQTFVGDLLACARDRKVCVSISRWDVDAFESARTR